MYKEIKNNMFGFIAFLMFLRDIKYHLLSIINIYFSKGNNIISIFNYEKIYITEHTNYFIS